jgi:SAM-dependent methyltransferase
VGATVHRSKTTLKKHKTMSLKFVIQKLQQQPMRIRKRLRAGGVGETIGWFTYQISWRFRERRLGIDTWEHAYGLDVNGTGGGQYYDPVDSRCFDTILDHLSPDPHHDVFLDYGCGLGRAVILAALRPFRRVIGVEINDELVSYCRKHVEVVRSKGKLKCDVEIVHQDAANYSVPHDVNRVFIFNAFVDDLLHVVLEQVRKSLAECPRDLVLVYVPLIRHENALDAIPWLRQRCQLPTAYWDHVRVLVFDAQLEAIIDRPVSEPAALIRSSDAGTIGTDDKP